MDARGVQQILGKIEGLAQGVERIGAEMAATVEPDGLLSDVAKTRLRPIYREHSLRLLVLYAQLGESVCELIAEEAEDKTARRLVQLFRANFAAMRGRAQDLLRLELGVEAKSD